MHEQRKWTWTALVAIGVALGALFHQGGSSADANAVAMAPATSVATISLRRAMEGITERLVREEELKADITERELAVQALGEELKQLTAVMDTLANGSKERNEMLEQAIRKQVLLEVETKLANQLLGQRRTELQLGLFKKIKKATEAYAVAEGYDIVFVTDHEEAIPRGLGPNETNGAILSTRVMYASGAVDVTDAVVQRMNNEFNR